MSLNEFKGECRNFAAEKEQAHRKQMLKKMEKSFIQGSSVVGKNPFEYLRHVCLIFFHENHVFFFI
jgi:hypothetical protein